jgi:hypothetical protein
LSSIVFDHPEAPPMGVHFVYRSHYEGPSGKHVRVLDADSVLGWFQGVWERAKGAEDVAAWVEAELGTSVYGLASIFEAARDESLPPSKTDWKLKSYLEEHLYVEGEIIFDPHALQVLTDDDEIELAYFFLDDQYLKENPGRAVYLLHEDWRLPATNGEVSYRPSIETKEVLPAGVGEGVTYLAFLAFYDSGGLTDLDAWGGPCRIEGVRLPGLAGYLETTPPDDSWPMELVLLRSQLRTDEPKGQQVASALGRVAHLPVLRIGEGDLGNPPSGESIEQARVRVERGVGSLKGVLDHDPTKSLVGASDHLAQLCLHVGDFFGKDVYHQWIIFDDLWAGEHRDLAEGILRYAKRWDVLTA